MIYADAMHRQTFSLSHTQYQHVNASRLVSAQSIEARS